jgi:hypothetical protein
VGLWFDPLRSLDLSGGVLLAAMHRVHVTGDVHRKKESPLALRTLEILTLASRSGAPSRGGGLHLIDSLYAIAYVRQCPPNVGEQLALSISEATLQGLYGFLLLRNAVKRRQHYVDPGHEQVSPFDQEAFPRSVH